MVGSVKVVIVRNVFCFANSSHSFCLALFPENTVLTYQIACELSVALEW